MAQIGNYNGASIIAFPTAPGIRQLNLAMTDTNAMQRSPFTGSTQVLAWPGADFWSADLTLPQMTTANAAAWTAFLGECRGSLNVFPLGHPLFSKPLGTVTSASKPVVSGANNAMATTLNTKGWRPNAYRLLMPGDRLQIGSLPGVIRYHTVLDVVNSDGNGNATISIWPSLRETATDGEVIILNTPQGLWRLADNKRSVLSAETRLHAVTLKIVEAR